MGGARINALSNGNSSETGFTHRGTNVPKLMEPRVAVARGAVRFFESHREYAVAFAGVTAAEGRALYAAMLAARAEARHARVETAALKRQRDTAETALRRKMSHVIIFLRISLTPDDAQWQAFGLNAPKPAGWTRRRRAASTAPLPVLSSNLLSIAALEPAEFNPLPHSRCEQAA